jgi:hypothetical protein
MSSPWAGLTPSQLECQQGRFVRGRAIATHHLPQAENVSPDTTRTLRVDRNAEPRPCSSGQTRTLNSSSEYPAARVAWARRPTRSSVPRPTTSRLPSCCCAFLLQLLQGLCHQFLHQPTLYSFNSKGSAPCTAARPAS